MKAMIVASSVGVLLIGCTPMTHFEGSPRVENGRAGCERKCASQGLQFAGMVFVGEYSDACLCQVPVANPAPGAPQAASAASTAPAVAAVVTAQRIVEEQQRQQAARRAAYAK